MRILLGLVAVIAVLLLVGAVSTWLIALRIEARYPAEGRFVEVGGGRLHYVEAGPTTTQPRGVIVLLHGASSNHADPMLALGGRLSEAYRVISFDRPGHGWSDRIAGARRPPRPARRRSSMRRSRPSASPGPSWWAIPGRVRCYRTSRSSIPIWSPARSISRQ